MTGVAVAILGALFLLIVAPIWIVAHYLVKWRTGRGLSAEDEQALAVLSDSAARMAARIENLERILDAEAPGWRHKP